MKGANANSARKEANAHSHNHPPPPSTQQQPTGVAKQSEVTRYFEKTGILDALTKAFITMYEEKDEWPLNGPSHLLNLLSPGQGAQDEVDTMSADVYQLRARVQELTDKNEELKDRLRDYQMAQEMGDRLRQEEEERRAFQAEISGEAGDEMLGEGDQNQNVISEEEEDKKIN